MPKEVPNNRNSKRILILGASGFIGNALYKELCQYFDTYGTYRTPRSEYDQNQRFLPYDMLEDDLVFMLEKVRPELVISCLRGNFTAQVIAHDHLLEYVSKKRCKLFFFSSANVFDAYRQYPSYEYDKTLSESIYGRLKIKIENAIMRLPLHQWGILRLPMVFGNGSPRIREIKNSIAQNEALEVFPNLVMNVSFQDKICQQVHYLINRDKSGIYHLGSKDLVHHEEFIQEIVARIGRFNPIYKRVYTSNQDRYLAVLPRDNRLPKNLEFTYQESIAHHIPF